jgi:hypothetical protein
MTESMECCLCPEAIPFEEQITSTLGLFAKQHGLEYLPLYHDEAVWFVHEPEHDGEIRQLQVSAHRNVGDLELCFVPSVYYLDRKKHVIGELESIPEDLILNVPLRKFGESKFNEDALLHYAEAGWKNASSPILKKVEPEWSELPPEYSQKPD